MVDCGSFRAPYRYEGIVNSCLRFDNCQVKDLRPREIKKVLFGIQFNDVEE
jgi:hypothetical protein